MIDFEISLFIKELWFNLMYLRLTGTLMSKASLHLVIKVSKPCLVRSRLDSKLEYIDDILLQENVYNLHIELLLRFLFLKVCFQQVTIVLWKSANPVSIAHELWKPLHKVVNITSMLVGKSGFLKQAGNLIKLLRL